MVAGFQGINDEFELTTLGRGGSDTTAVALAQVTKRLVKSIQMLMVFMRRILEY